MSVPSKRTLPCCGATSPAIRPISVVLPAPLGPITAWNSPGGRSSVMASAATTPPKRLLNPSICRSGSAIAAALEQPFDAAVHIDGNQEQQRPEDQSGIFGKPRQSLLEHQKRRGADQRPEQGAESAQHHHDDQIARAR